MVSFAPLLLLVDLYGPIRDTDKSTIATRGIEKMKMLKVNRIPELRTVPCTDHVKSVDSLFKDINEVSIRLQLQKIPGFGSKSSRDQIPTIRLNSPNPIIKLIPYDII